MLKNAICVIGYLVYCGSACATDYPTPKDGDWTLRDFVFHTGEVLPELSLHYRTVGSSSGMPVLILHGTAERVVCFLPTRLQGNCSVLDNH